MKFGKDAKVETPFPLLKNVWKVIEHPYYIWVPRIIFGIALTISLVVAYIMT
jgi:hypothetical protein